MIVEKDSSVLGYPGEISKALDADHHNVCKYDSPRDPNYIAVRNALISLVSKINSTNTSKKTLLSNRHESQELKALLAIEELPDTDYIYFRDQWVTGTGDWFLQESEYLEWLNIKCPGPCLFWLNGEAATGKSVLSSSIINSLVGQGVPCQYFFMGFGDAEKRSLSLLLRSIAYQTALSMPKFLSRVLLLTDEAISFETADPRIIWERVFKSILFMVEEGQPLYWIIDGLDEAEDPRELIKLLSDISMSSVSIRVLLVSRKTSEILAALQKVPQMLKQIWMNFEGHLEDQRCYIRHELSMPGDAESREIIVQQIVNGAENNFLVSLARTCVSYRMVLIEQWVRFAVETLNTCHTQADIVVALERLPIGMEALYDRMASSIVQNPSSTDRELASTILRCVTCSLRVLTVAELSQALHTDDNKILDVQRSVIDLCGGFVVIDNGGNVKMIHHTACEYLFSCYHSAFYVDRNVAHKQMFLSCMQCLMAVGLRAKITGNQQLEFLEYAAQSWSSHLKLTQFDGEQDEQVFDVLIKFLKGHWTLIWIQMLATSKQLHVLILASKNISEYSAKRKEHFASQNKQDFTISKQALVESWAVDFVKIVGKFGATLQRDPYSIYKLIPPFCPKSSVIHLQFGKTKDKSLLVSGLSNENWDDSLARISFGLGTWASSISAAGAHVAVLFSLGSVFLYDSLVFEESTTSPIRHGERVYRMQLNEIGTLLATYGYLTTKVWAISTGECKISIQNIASRPRPLSMLFTNSSTTLLVGFEDKRLRSFDLNHLSPEWHLEAYFEEPELEGHFLNSSNYMALSKDGKLIAVAYRGHPLSAWETDGPSHIGHCWRQREQIARGEVIEAFWHPRFPELLGLYIEGVAFRWRPYDNEIDEIVVGGSKLAISRDGTLFATGDSRGTVSVFITSDFRHLYQMTSEDNVFGLAFSPDSYRLYDIRGHYGNAWEPSILIRFADPGAEGVERGSGRESLAQDVAITKSRSRRIEAITVLAESPIGRLYCCGTENGIVRLHDTQRGKLADLHISQDFLSIERLSWSIDGQKICFSGSSKKVIIMSTMPRAGSLEPLMETMAEIPVQKSTNGPIQQLLFHPDSSQLLVRSSSMVCIVSLTSFSVTKKSDMHTAECQWISHPQDPTLIVGIGPNTIEILDWDLAKRQTYNLDHPYFQGMSLNAENLQDQRKVDRVLVTYDKKHVLAQISPLNHKSKEKAFLYFEISSLSTSTAPIPGIDDESAPSTIVSQILPQHIFSQIALPLSFLSHNNLIFLSKTHTICSWRLALPSALSSFPPLPATRSKDILTVSKNPKASLGHRHHSRTSNSAEDNVKLLFPLPGDWISRDCLALCRIWEAERSFLCPRNGEVAVVRCSGLV